MHYDPYSNTQLRALRRDPTGRYVGFKEETPFWAHIGGGAAFGCLLAILLWLAI